MKAQYKSPEFANPELLQAIQNSNLETIKTMVAEGANINALDYSMTPLFVHAILGQNTQIIDFFLEQGALINPEYERVNLTPLGAACRIAAMADSIENINYLFIRLINLGAEINPANSLSHPLTDVINANGLSSKIIAQYLVNNFKADINPDMDYATTPLTAATQIAVLTGKTDLFFECIKLGAKINPVNLNQTSPLVTAIKINNQFSKIIATYLINSGAEFDSVTLYNSALYHAAITSNKDLCELLIEKGAELNKRYVGDVSIGDDLIRSGNLDMLQYFLNKGMQLQWDKALETSVVSQPFNIEVTKFLIMEADENKKFYDRKELLIKAINYQNQVISEFLIERFGNIDLSDYHGDFNFETLWSIDKAIKFNHPFSKFLNKINSTDTDELFSIVEALKKYNEVNKVNAEQVLTLIRNEKGAELAQKIVEKYGSDASMAAKALTFYQLKYTFKYGDKFVLTTQTTGKETDNNETTANQLHKMNLPETKMQSKTCIIDHKVCLISNDNKPLDDDINSIAEYGTHYVINKKGDLFVNAKGYNMCHSYFLKGTEGKTMFGDVPMYGYGKPVASGGHIKFKDGLITKITNGSGHYKPNKDQLKIVCKHFEELGVLSDDVVIEAYEHDAGTCVKVDNSEFLDNVVIGDILAAYPELG